MKKTLLFLFSLLILLTGCSTSHSSQPQRQTQNIGNPTAEEILKNNPEADLLQLRFIVYLKAEDNSWVQQEKLGSLQDVGEIRSTYDGSEPFENEMATKLVAGTKIYEAAHSSLIIVIDDNGKEIRYLPLIEG